MATRETAFTPQINFLKTELWYYRIVFLVFALLYVIPPLAFPNPQIKEFVIPRIYMAAVPVLFIVGSFVIGAFKKFVNEIAILVFLLITLHAILFLFNNNFNTHFEIAILTLILFSNLHIFNAMHLVLYNVTVLGVLEFILIAGSGTSPVSPVAMFLSVVSVMILAVTYQLFRLRQQRTQKNTETVLPTENIIERITKIFPETIYVTTTDGELLVKNNLHENKIFESDSHAQSFFSHHIHDALKHPIGKIRDEAITQFDFFILHGEKGESEKYIFWLPTERASANGITQNNTTEKITAVLASSGWGMLTCNSDGNILQVSAEVCHALGYNATEMQLLMVQQLVHPSDMAIWRQVLNEVAGASTSKAEIRFINKKGKPVYLKAIVKKAGTDITLFTEDITDWRLVQKELSDAKANVITVIENTNDIIFSVDMNHQVTVMNTAFKNFFYEQYDVQLNTNNVYRDYLPEDEKKKWNAMHTRVMRGEKINYRQEFVDENAGKHFFEISLNPILDEHNIITGVSFFGRDVTERMKYETEIIKAKETAESATAAKSRFLATMTHEIRTPLNGIVGILELLRTTSLKDKQREYVNTLRLSSENMLTIINDVLDFSKIESEKMELENKPFELKKVIEETFDLLYYRSLEKKLELFYNIDDSIPAFLMGDSLRLKQVLVNLAGNAIKFTDKGHVLITVQLQPTSDDTLEIKFTVKDTGPGLTEEQKSRLFKSYQQADESTFRRYGGTGLGLTISANLVALMNGKIWVESVPGKGSSFIFNIKTKAAPVAAAKSSRVNTKLLQGKKFLLLSADEHFKSEISELFEQWNISQKWVTTEAAARKELLGKTHFDALIFDAQLPDYLLYAEELKENIREHNMPVFVINATLASDEIVFGNKLFEAVLPTGINRLKLATVLVNSFYKNISAYYSSNDEPELIADGLLSEKYPLSILIAEDNPINQTLAQTVLEKLGYKIDMAGDGAKAVEKAKSKHYDLIFMDVQMPHLDGLEATGEIRKMPGEKGMPVIIAMTAFAMDGDKEKCIEAGMDDYISKPIRIENIQTVIEKWGTKKRTEKNKQAGDNSIEPVIDYAVVERLKDLAPKDDTTFLKSLNEMFAAQVQTLVKEIEDYGKANDLDAIFKTAHKLKGSSANIGAKRLAECCKKIEILSREKNSAALKAAIEDLVIVKDLTLREIGRL